MIVGSSSSTTDRAIVTVSVSVLPAASLAVTVILSLDEPIDKLSAITFGNRVIISKILVALTPPIVTELRHDYQ